MTERIRIVSPNYGIFDFYPSTDELVEREEQSKEPEIAFDAFHALLLYPTKYERTISLGNSSELSYIVLKHKLDWLKLRYKTETTSILIYKFDLIEFENDADYCMFLTIFSKYIKDKDSRFYQHARDLKIITPE